MSDDQPWSKPEGDIIGDIRAAMDKTRDMTLQPSPTMWPLLESPEPAMGYVKALYGDMHHADQAWRVVRDDQHVEYILPAAAVRRWVEQQGGLSTLIDIVRRSDACDPPKWHDEGAGL